MRKQLGVTMIGWIFLLTPVAIVVYAGIRATPIYLNYYKVVQAMQANANDLKDDEVLMPATITNALGRRFNVGYVEKPTAKEIRVFKNTTGNWEMEADYEEVVPLFGNLHLLMQFKKSVPIQ
jgi:hypothetical protein